MSVALRWGLLRPGPRGHRWYGLARLKGGLWRPWAVHHVEDDAVVAGVAWVAVPPPRLLVHVDLDIPLDQPHPRNHHQGVPEVGPAGRAGASRVEDLDPLPRGSPQGPAGGGPL